MLDRLALSIYIGTLFCIVFIVAPILLRTEENKNIAGRFYGRILWRFYKLAFLMLMVYLLSSDDGRIYAIPLMVGLALNSALSLYLKTLKKSIGDIDKVPYSDRKRTKFRRFSMLSTLLLILNFVISILVYIKTFGGGNGV
ncbi:hypothetical protein [Thermocrinis sp.]